MTDSASEETVPVQPVLLLARVIRSDLEPRPQHLLHAVLAQVGLDHVRFAGKPVSVPSLQSLPVLFPFTLTRPLAYVVSNSQKLILGSEGPSNQFVALRATL